MSIADFQASFEDHSSILVLLNCQRIEDQRDEAIQSVLRRIQKLHFCRASDVPAVSIKYVNDYPRKRNEWHQFQAHRAVRGVITLGKYRGANNVQSSLNRHGELVDPYEKTVLETRCIFVGKDVPTHPSENPVNDADCPLNLRREQCLFYAPDDVSQLEEDIIDFVSNIVIVLKSNRIRLEQDVTNKKVDDKMLVAPFERRDLVGLDVDSRQYRKRWVARNKKMLADISLQLGFVQEALLLYSEVMEIFKAVGDFLWLGAVYEGQCAASVGHLTPPGRGGNGGGGGGGGGLVRNQSFPMRTRRNTPTLLSNPVLVHPGSCKSLPVDVDPIEAKQFGRDLLTLDEIIDKVRESNSNYERYANAIGPHVEVNLKLTRLLSTFDRRLQATDFLQMAVVTYCRINEVSWKLGWYNVVAQLYMDIGCLRKAAFYTRIGAVQAARVHDGIKANNALCYQLMVKGLQGYQVDLLAGNPYEGRHWHPFSTPQPVLGWSRLQATLLSDLILTADRLHDGKKLAAHHCVYYLCYMFPFLEAHEAHQCAKKLDELTAETGALLLSGISSALLDQPLPEIHLINYPLLTRVKLLPLAAEPVKWRALKAHSQPDDGTPFIYAPTKNKASARQPGIEGGGIFPSKWVKGEVGSVSVTFQNAVSFALQVEDLQLITDGSFDCSPASFTIGPSEKGVPASFDVTVKGTPRSTGVVRILGYKCLVLGIRSRCLFKDAQWMHRKVVPAPSDDPNEFSKNFEFIVNCVPELPLLEVSGELQDNSEITVYGGEKKSYRVQLLNKSSVPVKTIEISVEGSRKVSVEWDQEELRSQLPIATNAAVSFNVTLVGGENFMPLKSAGEQLRTSSAAPSPISTPRQRRFQSTPNTPHRNHLRTPADDAISTDITISYSGGAGMEENYARKCRIRTRLTVLQSVIISQWDVLLADSADQCYLVLDIENRTPHEIELEYQGGKSLAVEKTCKIPVLIPRCKPSGGEEHLEELCRQHIDKHVKLRWSLTQQHRQVSGYANLNECRWTPMQVDTILSASVACEVFLQKRPYNADDEFILKMGVPLSVQVEAQNTSLCSLQQLLVSLHVYQDYQNGTTQASNICFHGPQKIPISSIEPGLKVKVSFSLLFLFIGDYKIEVNCSTLSGDCARAVSSQVEVHGDHKHYPLWRTCSPLEITVVDLERDPLLSVPL